MDIIVGGRGTGKTVELIKRSHSSSAVIVTATHAKAEAVKRKANELQIDIPDPVCIYSLIDQIQ